MIRNIIRRTSQIPKSTGVDASSTAPSTPSAPLDAASKLPLDRERSYQLELERRFEMGRDYHGEEVDKGIKIMYDRDEAVHEYVEETAPLLAQENEMQIQHLRAMEQIQQSKGNVCLFVYICIILQCTLFVNI